MKLFAKIFGAVYLVLGGLLLSNSLSPTGLAIVEDVSVKTISFAGVSLIFNGFLLLSLSRIKKGQAAMEFLMTYGWTILAAIGALGVISYYTIFASNTILNSPPFLSHPLTSIGMSFDPQTGLLQWEVKVGQRRGLDITSVSIDGCTSTTSPTHVSQGGTIIITATCSNGPPSGAFSISYNNGGPGGLNQVASGSFGSSSGSQQAQGGGDTLPPYISLISINGDSEEPLSTGDNSVSFYVSTDELSSCRAGLDLDESYTEMVDLDNIEIDCQYDAATDRHLCAFVTPISDNPAQLIYVSCIDSSNNENTADDNLDISLEITPTPPTQSNWDPPSGQELKSGSDEILLTISEPGYCKYGLDEDTSYENMHNVCTNIDQLQKSCDITNLTPGPVTVSIACIDPYNNADSTVTNTDLNYLVKNK